MIIYVMCILVHNGFELVVDKQYYLIFDDIFNGQKKLEVSSAVSLADSDECIPLDKAPEFHCSVEVVPPFKHQVVLVNSEAGYLLMVRGLQIMNNEY